MASKTLAWRLHSGHPFSILREKDRPGALRGSQVIAILAAVPPPSWGELLKQEWLTCASVRAASFGALFSHCNPTDTPAGDSSCRFTRLAARPRPISSPGSSSYSPKRRRGGGRRRFSTRDAAHTKGTSPSALCFALSLHVAALGPDVALSWALLALVPLPSNLRALSG